MAARLKFGASASHFARLLAPLPLLLVLAAGATQAIAQDKPPAARDEVAELFDYITTQKGVLGRVEQEEKTAQEAVAADTKKHDAIAPSSQTVNEQIKQKLLEFKPEADRRNASADGIIENWNNECDVNRVNKLPQEKAEICMRVRDDVQKTVATIREQVKKDALAFVGPKLLEIKAAQEKELAALTERIKQNTQARDDARARAKQTHAYLEEAHSRLGKLCLAAADKAAAVNDPHWRERLKYCESRGWDNASKKLLPLTDIKPPFATSPN